MWTYMIYTISVSLTLIFYHFAIFEWFFPHFCYHSSCSPNPCQNGANCDLQDGSYHCVCAPGYRGVNCTLDINECSSGPCQNGATCQDMPNAFICVCTTGYNGTLCEIDVNLCAESPCHEGSTCVDLVSTFHCVCPPHRLGNLCHDTPCQNGALFVLNENLYTCQCVAGYTGLNCEIDFNECASTPCSNGGACVQHQLNAFMCECPRGFQGNFVLIIIIIKICSAHISTLLGAQGADAVACYM